MAEVFSMAATRQRDITEWRIAIFGRAISSHDKQYQKKYTHLE